MSDTNGLEQAFSALSGLVLEDGRPWIATAAPYQIANARAILDPDGPVRQHFITAPRGGRKTTDIGAVSLAILLTQAPRASRSYIGASDVDQAAELIDCARGLVERTPGLSSRFTVTEDAVVDRRSGASLTALPCDASAMGKRPYLIVLDEVANWPETKRARRFWDVLVSASRKVAGCRLVVITNAGTPAHWAHARYEVAKGSDRWRLMEVPGPLPWLSEDDVEALRENLATESEFRRLILNEWVQAEDALATLEDIRACVRLERQRKPEAAGQFVIGLDLATVKDNAVAAVAHAEPGGVVVVDRLRVWTPRPGVPVSLTEVEESVKGAAKEFTAKVVFDPYEARGMAERLTGSGIRCDQYSFTSASAGRLGVTLHNLITDHMIALPDDDDLVDELAHVKLRRSGPGSYRLDHDAGRHDDRAVAIALAATALVSVPAVSYEAAREWLSAYSGRTA